MIEPTLLCELLVEAVPTTDMPQISLVERYGAMGLLALVIMWGLRRIVEQLASLATAVNRNTRVLDKVADRVGIDTTDDPRE